MTIDRTNAELEQEIRETRGRRFLAAGARSGNGHGYLGAPQRELQPGDSPETVARIAAATSIFDEPESPGPAVIDAQADLAAHYNALRRAAEIEAARANRHGLSIEHRIADARRRAKAQHRNIRNDLFVVERMIERARRAQNTFVPAAAIARIEAVEARLDGPVEAADATCG